MSEAAIRVDGLGKQYRLGGARESYSALRDKLAEVAQRPARAIRAAMNRHSRHEEDPQQFWALKDVSFEVKPGEVVGIIGRNGAGKSTLLKILSRITEPTTGYADIRGRVGSLLEVGTGFHPELTGRENIYLNAAILGIQRRDIERKFDDIVSFAEVEQFLDTPVKRYSSGMYLRLAFAVAAHLEPEVLVIDEVLAVGDAAFQKKCLGKMDQVAKEGRTILFVSHNMGAIRHLCTQGLLLAGGRVEQSGDVESIIQCYMASAHQDSSTSLVRPPDQTLHPGRDVRLIGFQARSGDAQGGPPRAGAPTVFVAEYENIHRRPVRRLYLGITVRDAMGTALFFCSTQMCNADFYDAPPLGQLLCQISYLPLMPGRYWVDLKFASQQDHVGYPAGTAGFDVIDTGDSGFVAYPGRQSGAVLVPHQWMLEPITQVAPAVI